ncbi:MAG: ATP-binding cassette domain-containing protein [Butyricimonas faecihominis]
MSFAIQPGEFVTIMGTSGSIRSRLVECVRVFGHTDIRDIIWMGCRFEIWERMNGSFRNLKIGFIFSPIIITQNNSIGKRGITFIVIFLFETSEKERLDALGGWVKTGFTIVQSMSGGQQQRVAIARVVNDPVILR